MLYQFPPDPPGQRGPCLRRAWQANGSHRTGRAPSTHLLLSLPHPWSSSTNCGSPELLRALAQGGGGTQFSSSCPRTPEASGRRVPREPSSWLGRQVPPPHQPPCLSVHSSSSLCTPTPSIYTSHRVGGLSREADERGSGDRLDFHMESEVLNHEINQNFTPWGFPELLKILTLRGQERSLLGIQAAMSAASGVTPDHT